MGRKEVYEARLKELNWTSYRLAQQVVKLRQARGDKDVTFKGIESSVRKCLSDPDRRASYLNDDLVTVMGGEIVIRWQQVQEVQL
jgi:hypothetical protein